MESVISTGDKDLTQLVTDRILWVNTMATPYEKLDPAGVKAKFGVPPELIVDYLALIGDAVDNVPGVDKVGPKTACKLIEQYGSLDGVIAHADEVKGVVGENLRRGEGRGAARGKPPPGKKGGRSPLRGRVPRRPGPR